MKSAILYGLLLLLPWMAQGQPGLPIEKLYLSFDKPYYAAGDTLYFKSVLLNGISGKEPMSDKIYVELFNDSLRLIERKVFLLNNGLGYGDFSLANNLSNGTYAIRAYTNWQQNFGSDYFFQKAFSIGNQRQQPWLFSLHHLLDTTHQNTALAVKVKINTIDGKAVGLKDLDIQLLRENKRILEKTVVTQANGTFEERMLLPSTVNSGNYQLQIADKKDRSKKFVLPIHIPEVGLPDLQFMPEGGRMVAGLQGTVAFKVLGSDGLGKALQGKVVNSKNEMQTAFTTHHKGMGSFSLLPQASEKYTAVYQHQGREYRIPLPPPEKEGTLLRVDHLSHPDSVYCYLSANGTLQLSGYQLLARSNTETLFALQADLKNGRSIVKMAKKQFPQGIINFTLLSPLGTPLNDRTVFINQPEPIHLNIETHRTKSGTRDSISLTVYAKKEDGSPLQGSFAVAVTNDQLVKHPADEANIASYFLLQSELKGHIEEPSWYFNRQSAKTDEALDLLLLTQGWITYKWATQPNKEMKPLFTAEKGNHIRGTLKGLLNKPMPNVSLTLLSLGKQIYMRDTLSTPNGSFSFLDLPLIDTASYVVKIRKPNGKTSGATIFVEEFKPNSMPPLVKAQQPWYVNADTSLLRLLKSTATKNEIAEKRQAALSGHVLKEVEIFGYRPDMQTEKTWDAYFLRSIKEEEIKKKGRKTVFDLMKEVFPELQRSRYWGTCSGGTTAHAEEDYVVGTRLISWIRIDSVECKGETTRYFFENILAEDIKEITIYKGCWTFYVDIKTRSGKGPWAGRPIGIYAYRPLPINIAKEFYSPKYKTTEENELPDFRSTLLWDANVVTDEQGKATLSFFTADSPGTYTVKIEGTDLQGRFGFHKDQLRFKPPASR